MKEITDKQLSGLLAFCICEVHIRLGVNPPAMALEAVKRLKANMHDAEELQEYIEHFAAHIDSSNTLDEDAAPNLEDWVVAIRAKLSEG